MEIYSHSSINTLSKQQNEFLFKRQFYLSTAKIAGWSLIGAVILSFAVLIVFKQELINPSYLLELLRSKQIDTAQLAELALSGISAIGFCLILLVVLAMQLLKSSQRETQYLAIIEQLKKND